MERVIHRIETLLEGEKRPILLSIEGGAGSGKTTLAARLSEKVGGAVHHMDDFFLPPALRTPERLSAPGAGVHYERFQEEVIEGIFSGAPFSYGVFDCSVGEITKERKIGLERLHIIEGVYSAHPFFGDIYDLRIFLEISEEEQIRRIRARNKEKAEMFFTRWIPMENRYFKHFAVKENSDLIL